MTKREVIFLGLGAVAGSAVTALFFLVKEGLLYVGDTPIMQSEPSSEILDSEQPIAFEALDATQRQIVAYNTIIDQAHYGAGPVEHRPASDIRMVTEEEYYEAGRDGYYDLQALTLYSDGVLANSVTDVALSGEDREASIGQSIDSVRHLLSESESIYICNDTLMTQYEITYDDRTYKEVTGLVIHSG